MDNWDRGEHESRAVDASEGLYHEPQADGVPYDEDIEPFTRELPKLKL